MASKAITDKISDLWDEKVVANLQDPATLRITLLSAIGVLGLGLVGLPLFSSIGTLQKQLIREKERSTLIKEQALLTTKMKQYNKRLPDNGTMNWWTGYLVNASRSCDIKIAEYKPYAAQSARSNIGHRRGMLLRFEMVGTFAKVLGFVGWLENQVHIVHIASILMSKESASAPLRTTITIAVLTDRQESVKIRLPTTGAAGMKPSLPNADKGNPKIKAATVPPDAQAKPAPAAAASSDESAEEPAKEEEAHASHH